MQWAAVDVCCAGSVPVVCFGFIATNVISLHSYIERDITPLPRARGLV